MPRYVTRSSARSALIVAVRSVLMWSREVTRTRTADRTPSSARGVAQLAHAQWENGLGDAAGIEGVGLAEPAVSSRIHPRGFDHGISGLCGGAGQAGAIGAGAFDHPHCAQVTAGAAAGPRDGALQPSSRSGELGIVDDFAVG